MEIAALVAALVVVILILLTVGKTVRIVPQARARNVERFGRYRKTLEPGMNFILPFVDRVKLHQLYHERGFGISADDSNAVNWITKLAWTGPASFIALGWSRWADGSLHPYGVVTGSISGGQATLTRIAGTELAVDFTPATIAGGVLFIDGATLAVRRATSPA